MLLFCRPDMRFTETFRVRVLLSEEEFLLYVPAHWDLRERLHYSLLWASYGTFKLQPISFRVFIFSSLFLSNFWKKMTCNYFSLHFERENCFIFSESPELYSNNKALRNWWKMVEKQTWLKYLPLTSFDSIQMPELPAFPQKLEKWAGELQVRRSNALRLDPGFIFRATFCFILISVTYSFCKHVQNIIWGQGSLYLHSDLHT